MAQGFKIEGGSGNLAKVTTHGDLNVVLPLLYDGTNNDAIVGAAVFVACNDNGSVTGTQTIQYPYVSPDFRTAIGQDVPLATHYFTATSQDTGKWKHLFTTMTATQTNGFLTLNANSTATITTGCSMSTWQVYPLQVDGSLFVQMSAAFNQNLLAQAGQNVCWGLFNVSTVTTETTDGVYFRYTSSGLEGVIKNNTSPAVVSLLTSGQISGGSLVLSRQYKFAIIVAYHHCSFWINDVLYGVLEAPSAVGTTFASGALPLSYHFFNTSAVSGTQMQFRVTNDDVIQMDVSGTRLFGDVSAFQGAAAYQGQDGGTQGSTANYANNTAPTAAVPTNTAALVTGLGGQAYSTNTLAVNTDGIIFSYQNPAGGVSQQPRQLIIKGVKISTAVQTTLANAGGALYQWSLAYGHTAVSLATTESTSFANNTSKAPRRIALGLQCAIGALVQGSQFQELVIDFSHAPVVVNPGEFVAFVMKNGGTVGTAGTLSHHVTVIAVWGL